MKKIAIIGSGELQTPLILKAKSMGYNTFVFSRKNNSIGEKECTKFFDIDVLDIDNILKICREIKIDAITSIASDITTKAVAYVAKNMKLIGNSLETLTKSTNKYEMRKAFKENDLVVPKNYLIKNLNDIKNIENELNYPVIVKPVDRAGSVRGY